MVVPLNFWAKFLRPLKIYSGQVYPINNVRPPKSDEARYSKKVNFGLTDSSSIAPCT